MREKKKTIDKKSANSKLKEIAQKQKLQEKGITLIALVVTIIILLILAGVTLNIALSDNGLFNKAKKATDDYEEAQDRELEEIDKIGYEFQDIQDELSGKLVLNGKYSEKNKVNMPNLAHTGLTAVTFNETATVDLEDSSNTAVQIVSDEEIQKDNWYSYSNDGNSKWANAQTVDKSMWVWIPRFAYNIKYENINDKSQGGTIDVVFLKGTTDEPAPTTSEGKDSKEITIKRATDEDIKDKKSEEIFTADSNTYIIHPAFTNESSSGYANGGWDEEISGFWMAKFEAGYVGNPGEEGAKEAKDSSVKYSTILTSKGGEASDEANYYYGKRTVNVTNIKFPTFQANRPSMNYIGISDAYELCQAMNKTGNPYGLKSSSIDSHLTKNSEWGAVAYLSYSQYGTNKKLITANNSNTNGTNSVWAVTGYANIGEMDINNLVAGISDKDWKSTEGQKASTTGNIFGIYDMCGGLYDITAGYILITDDINGGKLINENNGDSSKYKSKYELSNNGEKDTENYSLKVNLSRFGEAIWETSKNGSGNTSWGVGGSWFLLKTAPFTFRGRDSRSPTEGWLLTFNRYYGGCSFDCGFRPILICK